MDILNFISWIRGRRQVTSVDPAKTLLPVGIQDPKRDDEYIAGAITVEDFAAQVAPTPAYKVYTALLTQSGTNAPVEISVLENNLIEDIFFERESDGSYLISGVDYPVIFKSNKTFITIGNGTTQNNSYVITAYPADEASVRINTTINNVPSDDVSGDFFPIEIRVYN